MFAATVSIPIWQMMVLLFIAAYPIGMWFTAFLLAKDFAVRGSVDFESAVAIFFGTTIWPLLLGVFIVMWLGSRTWQMLKSAYGRLPTCLRKALYWMQFVVRPVHLAEVLNQKKEGL